MKSCDTDNRVIPRCSNSFAKEGGKCPKKAQLECRKTKQNADLSDSYYNHYPQWGKKTRNAEFSAALNLDMRTSKMFFSCLLLSVQTKTLNSALN